MATLNLPPQGFYVINPEDEAKYDIFRVIPELGTRALYNIDAADKAMAVPTIKIWKLKGGPNLRTNTPEPGPPLSDQFTELPDFGKSVGAFSERPPVSIEGITVKKVNPGGWIMYRELNIAITVHRPDVLNEPGHGNVISSLLQPGNSFLLEYGWVGGRNPILGPGESRKELEPEYNPREEEEARRQRQQFNQIKGIGSSANQASTLAHNMHEQIASKRPAPIKPEYFGTVFTAVQQLRFSVVNYGFSITTDNQLKFQIHAIEDGELQIRNTTIFEQPDLPQPVSSDLSKTGEYLDQISNYLSAKLKDLAFTEKVQVDDPKGVAGQTKVADEEFIELQDVLNTLIAMPIVRAVGSLGYGHVHLYTGVFNAFAPKTNASLGGREWASMPIGSFWLKLKDVQGILNNIVHSKQQITIYNMLIQFLGLISNPAIYDLNPLGTSMPEMQVFTLFNPKASYARIQVVDRKRYLTVVRGAPDGTNEVTYTKNRESIRQNLGPFLAANHMPHFRLGHQNSFFKDAKFDVVNDEQMKSIFLNRQIKRTREQVTTGDPRQTDANSGLPQDLMLYRSAVKGQVTVIGNFVYDLLGLVWVSFGVAKLDGIFYVLSKVDQVNRDGFYSTLTLQAEGSDPLGAGGQPPLVAEDFVKSKISAQASSEFATQMWASVFDQTASPAATSAVPAELALSSELGGPQMPSPGDPDFDSKIRAYVSSRNFPKASPSTPTIRQNLRTWTGPGALKP